MKIEDIENREDEESSEKKEPVKDKEDSCDKKEPVSNRPFSKLDDDGKASNVGRGPRGGNPAVEG